MEEPQWDRGTDKEFSTMNYTLVVVNGEIFHHFMASLEAMVGNYLVVFIMNNAPIHTSMPETYPTLQFSAPRS